MKELVKIQLVRKCVTRMASLSAVLYLSTLCFFQASQAFAASERAVTEIKIGQETRPLYPLAALPEVVSIPVLSDSGQVNAIRELSLISVSDRKDLYGVVVPTEGGFFGTVVDLSKKIPVYYQLSPGKKGQSKNKSSKQNTSLSQEVKEVRSKDLLSQIYHDDKAMPQGLYARAEEVLSSEAKQQSWRELELFVVSTSEFSATRSEENITAQILSTVAAANLFFEPLELKITLSGVQILRAGSDPYAEALNKLDADQMLSVVRAEWSGKTDVKRDVVAVFGTSNFKRYTDNVVASSDIFGLSYTGMTCTNADYSVLFASQGSLDSKGELSLAGTLAHELGHTLGMSHDPSLYGQVPSLMYPTFTYSSGGFSDTAIKQYLTYAGVGKPGGECLSAIEPPSIIAFEGGASETINIKEGERFSRQIKVTGRSAVVSVSSMSADASFDPASAVFSFKPSFELANKRTKKKTITQKLVAELADGRKITKEFVFNVLDVNRAPQFKRIRVSRGNTVRVTFDAIDLDGDKLTLSKRTVRNIGKLGGRKNLRFDGKRLVFTWIPPKSHRHTALRYRITDVGGLSSTYTIRSIS